MSPDRTPDDPIGSATRSWGRTSVIDDPRIAQALVEYHRLEQEGLAPSREEFLARHPGIAAALAECLDGLDFLKGAASGLIGGAQCVGTVEEDGPTRRLGDFHLIRELGRGGMGVVYEARQESLGRRVALKVMPPATALDPRLRRRFQVEAQAAALLCHRHIVPVFAVGCEGEVPYYAMQYIEGRTLADWIGTLRSAKKVGGLASIGHATPLPGPPASGSSDQPERPANGSGGAAGSFYREVARLGWQAAEALDHAHGLGVLHRDVKPSNLMLDARGDLWMTDFGLARIAADPGVTASGDMIGTLRYMSPEQALGLRGQVDSRADLYALGATLYELATLKPAFDGRDRQELLRRIAQTEPIAPRRIDPALPRDLETIILKAMAKEPIARYATARDLADDLQRFLDDRPILARPPGAGERVARWGRRHRAVLTTAAAVLIASTGLAATLLVRENDRTRAALDSERRSLQLISRSIDDLLTESIDRYYENQKRLPEAQKFAREVLGVYEHITRIDGSEPERRALVANAWRRIGNIRVLLDEPDAPGAYRKAVDLFEELVARTPDDPDLRLALADTLDELATRLEDREPLARRERARDQARAIRVSAIAKDGTRLKIVRDLARSDLMKAADLEKAGRSADAARTREGVIQLVADGAPKMIRSAEDRHLLAQTCVQLGNQLEFGGHTEDAAKIMHVGVTYLPDDPKAWNNLAWEMVMKPNAPTFNPQRALDLARRAVDADPDSWFYHNTLGVALYRAEHWSEARETLERSIELHEGPNPHDGLFLAMTLDRLGDRAAAMRIYREVREMPADTGTPAELAAIRAEAREALEIGWRAQAH